MTNDLPSASALYRLTKEAEQMGVLPPAEFTENMMENKHLKSLITELADALEGYLPTDVHSIMLRPAMYSDRDQKVAEICQRAREVAQAHE